MKRIDIRYGGESYSIGNRDPHELRAEIVARTAADPAGWWLEVNAGEGEPRPSFLFVTPGTDLALTPIPGDDSV